MKELIIKKLLNQISQKKTQNLKKIIKLLKINVIQIHKNAKI